MWKQFLELIPHLTQLLPHVERFIQQRNAGDDVQKQTLDQFALITEGLRADLAKASASQASLYRQLNEQGEKMSTLAADLHESRAALQSAEARIANLEGSLNRITLLIAATLSVTVLTFAVVLFFHLHR